MNDILSVILIIVFGLIVSFLVFSLTFSVLYSFSDSDFFEHFFELSAKICLVGALILLAVEMLLFAGIGVASFVTFLEGA